MLRNVLATCLLGLALTPSAQGTSVLPLYLDEIVDTSAVAFDGTCIENRIERDQATNFIVTYTTFAVSDVLKGAVPGTTYTIKQIGGTIPGERSFRIEGVPTFAIGEEYIVFLAGVSSAGFSSPIGLQQGKFTVRDGLVSNGRDFNEMISPIPAQELPAALKRKSAAAAMKELDIDSFKQLVRSRAVRAR
jgi:hypothetical protein